MANFRTHLSFGLALGVIGALATVFMALGESQDLLLSIFCIATVGAILPDMDSDSGIPFHVTFGMLSLLSGVGIFFLLEQKDAFSFIEHVGIALGSIGFVWLGVGSMFKRLTRHRGMAHSLPAVFLFGLVVFFFASRYLFSDAHAFLLALSGMAGYLLHLILDEAYSLVDFHGRRFTPKRSLGSALKFFSSSRKINIFVYGLLFLLFFPQSEKFRNLLNDFISNI